MPKEARNQNIHWCSVGWIKHGSPTSDLERGPQRCQSTGFKGWILDWFTQSSDLFDMKTRVILIVDIHYPSTLSSSKKTNPQKTPRKQKKQPSASHILFHLFFLFSSLTKNHTFWHCKHALFLVYQPLDSTHNTVWLRWDKHNVNVTEMRAAMYEYTMPPGEQKEAVVA